MNAPRVILETERLALRELSTDDAPFLLRLLNEPSYHRFIGDRGVRTLDGARDYILTKFVASYQRHGFGLYLTTVKDSAAPAGICGLIKRDSLDDVDIGFAFLPEFWSKGYASESASAVMSHARGALGLRRVLAITSQDNVASINVLRKLGFRFERLIRLSDAEPEINLFASDGWASTA